MNRAVSWVGILMTLATMSSVGCAARAAVSIEKLNEPPCAGAWGIGWAGPNVADHRTRLSAWCKSVGPIVVQAPNLLPADVNKSGLIVLTWNQHEDYGDLERLLRSVLGRSPIIALLQEVARTSESVPRDAPATVRVPQRINPRGQMEQDIEAIAGKFNLSLAYLPSMPNGIRTGEDRGSAILSSLPISEVMGIELPWVAQRRVTVMATVTAIKDSIPWRLRVVSVHLDNRSGRSRQAAAIADFLDSLEDMPTAIGGDLNSLRGIQDRAVAEIDGIVPRVHECGAQPTFRLTWLFGLRLDHLFTNLPKQVRVGCAVERNRFGSDHNPIVLHLFKH